MKLPPSIHDVPTEPLIGPTRHKGRGIETEHPAVFPVALPEFLMRAYTDEGDIVFEPFGGSGTTILAGQRTARRVSATAGVSRGRRAAGSRSEGIH